MVALLPVSPPVLLPTFKFDDGLAELIAAAKRFYQGSQPIHQFFGRCWWRNISFLQFGHNE